MYPDALVAPERRAKPRVVADGLSTWRAIRVAERLACIVALAVLSPIWLTVAIVIMILSGDSPLVAVLRAGRFGRPLWLLKFRTMWPQHGATSRPIRFVEYVVDEDGPQRKDSTDPRVTSGFARFCRQSSLDEIPQLLNVIAGEMSLVAPRPLTSSELSEHYGKDAAEVLSVRPGITGLWQVSGRNALSYEERRRLDVQLVRTLTPKLYLRILLRTIPVVVTGRNSW
jgi:exopolysaccharide production protein ExoY